MIKLLLISAFVMLGIAIAVLVWEFVYGQPLDERKIEMQFEDHFENTTDYCHDHFGNGSSICHELPDMMVNTSDTLVS